jgi:hypothetical protein
MGADGQRRIRMAQRSPDVGGDDDAYADEPAPLGPKQIATLLDASRRAIILEVEALVPHGDFRPMPGIWCPNEVVGHLIEADKRGFQVGDVTVRDILHERVHHDRDHLAQLTALTQRPVWPGMGNARRFSQPDA